MRFENALPYMRGNAKMARSGWNGKDMSVAIQFPDENSANTLPYLYIEYPKGHAAYPDGARVPWLASQTDLLADDWVLARSN